MLSLNVEKVCQMIPPIDSNVKVNHFNIVICYWLYNGHQLKGVQSNYIKQILIELIVRLLLVS